MKQFVEFNIYNKVVIYETTRIVHPSAVLHSQWYSLDGPRLPYGYSYIKHPVPDLVKPSFVIFDIWAL